MALTHSCLTSLRKMGEVVVLSANCAFFVDCLLGCSGASCMDLPSGEVTSSVLDPICVMCLIFEGGNGDVRVCVCVCVSVEWDGDAMAFAAALVSFLFPNGIVMRRGGIELVQLSTYDLYGLLQYCWGKPVVFSIFVISVFGFGFSFRFQLL